MTTTGLSYGDILRTATANPTPKFEAGKYNTCLLWFKERLFPLLEKAAEEQRTKFITGLGDERIPIATLFNDIPYWKDIFETQGLKIEYSVTRRFAVISW